MNCRAIALVALLLSAAWGQDKEKGVIALRQGMFSRDLGMMDAERDEYATHLAEQAANLLAGGDEEKEMADRLLALARLLSARNKRVHVVSGSMEQGAKPELVKGAFSTVSLARLLLVRGKMLIDEEGAENHWVGRAFVEMAAELDSKNTQAVQERKNQEFDFGVMDWTLLGGKK